MADELTISRADLIEIATEALAGSEGVTDEQKLEMCETAHKAPKILLGGWLTKECGCLVGETYRDGLPDGRPWARGRLSQPMMRLGGRFDMLLRIKLDAREHDETPVRVIDP